MFAFLWNNYKRHFEFILKQPSLLDKNLNEILELNIKNEGTARVYISNWLNFDPEDETPTSLNSIILSKFDSVEKIVALTKKFDIPPTVFEVSCPIEIDAILEQHDIKPDYDVATSQTLRLYPELPSKAAALELHPVELSVLGTVAAKIIKSNSILLEWVIPFQSGAGYIAEQLKTREDIATQYKQIFVLSLDPTDLKPSENGKSEFKTIAKNLNVPREHWGREASVAKAIVDSNALIIVNGATSFENIGVTSHPIKQIINMVSGNRKRWGTNRPHFLLVANQETGLGNMHERLPDLSNNLLVPHEQRMKFFRSQLQRFIVERGGGTLPGEDDPRMKRVRWHYDQVRDIAVYPASIRLRAFFASNFENENYFDPTQGFEALAGMEIISLPDISSLVSETNIFINQLSQVKDNQIARFLRRCSTAVYWLTEGAIQWVNERGAKEEDIKAQGGKARTGQTRKTKEARHFPALDQDKCESVSMQTDFSQLFKSHIHGFGAEAGYAIPLGVKAIVQDHWLKSGNASLTRRSWIHFLTAKRMYDDREELDVEQELPYERSKGGKEIFFLTEVIRHLMRACGEVLETDKDNPEVTTSPYRRNGEEPSNPPITLDVPEPEPSRMGVNPYRAWSFAKHVIFDHLLDQNRKRALTKMFGAYSLKLELLQLLSGDNVIGRRHHGMSDQDYLDYLTETGFALLDVGRLEAAAEMFEQLAELLKDSEQKTFYCHTLLNQALVVASMGEFESAEALLKTALNTRVQLEKQLEADIAEQSIGRGAEIKQTIYARLKRRHLARAAQIAFLSENETAAINIYSKLESHKYRPTITRDRALTYVYALASRDQSAENENERSDLMKAFSICLSNLTHSSSKANFHEVLGFEIALAMLHRKMKMYTAAEACLDQAYLDILRDGCSERVYISFLLEAGQVMIESGRPARAYAAYLQPCFYRLQNRRYHYHRNEILPLLDKALSNLLFSRRRTADDMEWRSKLLKDITTPEYLQRAVTPLKSEGESLAHKIYDRNPHYSFDLVGVEHWLEIMMSEDSIRKEKVAYKDFSWK